MKKKAPAVNPIVARLDAAGAAMTPPMSREAIAKAAGVSRDAIRQLERRGRYASVRAETIKKLAAPVNLDPRELYGLAPEPGGAPPLGGAARDSAGRIPIRGTAAGSSLGAHDISDEPVGWVASPPALVDVPGAYAIYVRNDSMSPMHSQGDLRFVHPHKPPRPGESVLITVREDEASRAYIKIFLRYSGDWIVCRQLNPSAEVKFSQRQIEAVHRVLTVNEMFNA